MDRYFSLKLMRLDLTPNGANGGGGIGVRRLRHPPNLEKMKSFTSKDAEDEAMGGMMADSCIEETSETGMDQATADRIEEARLAEEALASNLKLLKKQKAKFLRLQKILSRNVFLIPMCAIFSVLSAATIFFSSLSHNLEHTYYDIGRLNSLILSENNRSAYELSATLKALNRSMSQPVNANEYSSDQAKAPSNDNLIYDPNAQQQQQLSASIYSKEHEHEHHEHEAEKPHEEEFFQFQEIQFHGPQQFFNVPHDQQRQRVVTTASPTSAKRMPSIYFYALRNYSDHLVISRHTNSLVDNSSVKYNVIFPTYSGVWCFCNTLSEKSRRELNLSMCTYYRTTNIESESTNMILEEDMSDSGRDLVRMHNAAACCVIVCYFLLGFSWFTGLAAVLTKKVPVSLATAVLNLLIAVFLALLLAIIHRKIISEERQRNCFDLKTTFDIVCKSRIIKFGYSLGLTWLSLLFTIINGVCWFHITKMQKLLFTHGYF